MRGARRNLLGKRASDKLTKTLAYVLLTLGGIVMFMPFFWLVGSSLKEPSKIFILPPQWIPQPARWRNYTDLFTLLPFGIYTRNTLIVVIGSTIGTVFTSSLSAYAFARLRWPGRDTIFVVLLATMMLPGAVTMIPVFIIFKDLRWLDTFLPLIVPAWCGGGAFFVFLQRQFFLTLPLDLDNAARIDGASSFRIYTSLILPLSRPVLAVIAIFSFMGSWNDFLGPLIYLNSPTKRTLALGIEALQGLKWGRDMTELLMAAGVLMIIPALGLFIIAQDVFVRGIVLTGIKG